MAVLILAACAQVACADGSFEDFRLDGFRDLKWGDSPAALGKGVSDALEVSGGLVYMRPKEKSSMFGVYTKQPSYFFGKNGFENVSAYIPSHDALGRLLAMLGKNRIRLTSVAPLFEGGSDLLAWGQRQENIWFAEIGTVGISIIWYSTFGEISVYRVMK